MTTVHITCLLLLGLCCGLEGKAIDAFHVVEETTDETTSDFWDQVRSPSDWFSHP